MSHLRKKVMGDLCPCGFSLLLAIATAAVPSAGPVFELGQVSLEQRLSPFTSQLLLANSARNASTKRKLRLMSSEGSVSQGTEQRPTVPVS